VAENLLVVLVGETDPGDLRDALAALPEPPARIRVVAPAVEGALDWLATADDAPLRRAEVRALEAEWTLAELWEVEAAAGDPDPLQAVEDALRTFPADEVALAGDLADRELADALAGLGVPVRLLSAAGGGRRRPARRLLRALAGGRWVGTPFVLFVGVNALMLLAGVVLSLLVLLVLWTAGYL
jgi:hypothetical protein